MHTLQRRDPLSGVGLWTLQLDSPPVAVHLADGSNINLYAQDGNSNESMIVVGMLKDSMYALPVSADWLQRGLPQHSVHSSEEPEITRLSLASPGDSVSHTPCVDDSQGVEDSSGSAQSSSDQQQQQQPQQHGHVRKRSSSSKESHALVPMHSMDIGHSYAWQSPVSVHPVLPSTLAQTFLPQIMAAADEVESTAAQASRFSWRGKDA